MQLQSLTSYGYWCSSRGGFMWMKKRVLLSISVELWICDVGIYGSEM